LTAALGLPTVGGTTLGEKKANVKRKLSAMLLLCISFANPATVIYKRAINNSRERSAAVTAAGVVAIIGSVLTALGVLLGLFGLFIAPALPNAPQSPLPLRTLTMSMMFVFLGVAIGGVFTGVGLLRLKDWARISVLVWAGITAPISMLSLVAFAFLQFPSSPNAPANFTVFFHIFAAIVYGVPLGIAIWWLIFFTRKSIAAQFRDIGAGQDATSPPGTSSERLAPSRTTVPLPTVVLGWFFLLSAFSIGFVFLMRIPAVVFGFAIRGPAGTAFYVLWCLLLGLAGVGLLRRNRWSYSLAIGLHIFGLASGAATVLNPSYETLMKETLASLNLRATVAYPSSLMNHMRAYSAVSLLLPVVVLGILVFYRSRFLEACDGAPRP
jgi:hypothetical protein